MSLLAPLARAAALAAGALCLALPRAAPAATERRSVLAMPPDASLDGHVIDRLIHVTLVFVGILFAIMVVWMAWSMIFHGRRHPAVYDHGNSRGQIAVGLAIAAAIFVVVDGNLFVRSLVELDDKFWAWEKVEANPRTLRVQVNAHQWAWDFRLAGPDGKFNTPDDIVALNDLKVPVDTPVLLQLTSTDVIHNFYLPNFRVKNDVVPGTVNQLWFQARQTGEFEVACAQHCGTHHYKMRAKLTVLPREAWEGWFRSAAELAERAYDPDDTAAHWGWEWKRKI